MLSETFIHLSCLKEHAGQDKNSHMLQHSLETGHAKHT